jgi:hypothetical protein
MSLLAAAETDIHNALICLLIAALVGGGVYLFLAYLAKVAWAGAAAGFAFLIVLALCLL